MKIRELKHILKNYDDNDIVLFLKNDMIKIYRPLRKSFEVYYPSDNKEITNHNTLSYTDEELADLQEEDKIKQELYQQEMLDYYYEVIDWIE